MTKSFSPQGKVFIKYAYCPKCKAKQRLTMMGHVSETADFSTQAICPKGHFLRGVANP